VYDDIKPENAENYYWDQFAIWATENGVDDHWIDVEEWWNCWKRAIDSFKAGIQESLNKWRETQYLIEEKD